MSIKKIPDWVLIVSIPLGIYLIIWSVTRPVKEYL